MDSLKEEIAAAAARLVVEEGQEYGPAKRSAIKLLGLPARTALPDNETLQRAVREHIDLFCADTQPGELRALREMALEWMQRLKRFRPYVSGAVWHGTATRHSDIYLQLFCDDSKSAEIHLIDLGVRFDTSTVKGLKGEPVDALSIQARNRALGQFVGVHLLIHDLDDQRGVMLPDGQGRKPRGDAASLAALLHDAIP
jgi:hypothetical protein